MNFDLRDNLRRLLWRLLIAASFFGGGFWMLCRSNPFYGAALIIIGAMIVAFPAAELLARPIMGFYYPTESGPPPPNFSIPEARVKQGRYEDAMQEYAAIAAKYPTAMLAYAGMIEVAFKHLHDQARADAAYRQGMTAITDREQQASLHRLYTAFRSWAANPPR